MMNVNSNKKEHVNQYRPPPWIEIVGMVEEIGDESITLKVAHNVRIARDELVGTDKLRIGSRIEVLFLDDGSVRVRSLGVGKDGGGR